MASPEHLAILKQGVEEWNKWRREHPTVRPDLNEADLAKALLSYAHLHGAKLWRADLLGADLLGANLSNAHLRVANLGSADLRGANLRGANLTFANFSMAKLSGADFSEALTNGSLFADVDLSDTVGLETIEHIGPSSIGVDTIYKSHGEIPDIFLRGCGVPDEFIAYSRSMMGRRIEFYSCFISYSAKDQQFAEHLHTDLQDKGVRCWFAPHDIRAGRKLHEQIDEAIRLHERLLLILSADSMASEWVKTEIAKARKREAKEGKQVLFPVGLVPFEVLCDWECFDADTGKDSAREIREYFIPDFSNWRDHDSYQKALERLVKDLTADAAEGNATL